MEDIKGYPINYNHNYTDTIKSRRQNRQQAALAETVKQASLPQTFLPLLRLKLHLCCASNFTSTAPQSKSHV
jgi:hypothetical protein